MGKSAPAQGAELTGNVFGIDVSQGLQADNAGNTDAKDLLSRSHSKLYPGYVWSA